MCLSQWDQTQRDWNAVCVSSHEEADKDYTHENAITYIVLSKTESEKLKIVTEDERVVQLIKLAE